MRDEKEEDREIRIVTKHKQVRREAGGEVEVSVAIRAPNVGGFDSCRARLTIAGYRRTRGLLSELSREQRGGDRNSCMLLNHCRKGEVSSKLQDQALR